MMTVKDLRAALRAMPVDAHVVVAYIDSPMGSVKIEIAKVVTDEHGDVCLACRDKSGQVTIGVYKVVAPLAKPV